MRTFHPIFVLLLSLFLAMGSYLPSEAAGNSIIVLKSADTTAHNEAVTTIRSAFKTERVVVFTLNHNAETIFHIMRYVSLISPKVIIGVGNSAIVALKSAPEITIPTVFCLVTNLNGALSRPDSWVIPLQSHPKHHRAYLNRFFPDQGIGIPFNPNRSQAVINDLVAFFRSKSIKLYPFPVENPSEMSTMLKATKSRYDALWILPDDSIIDGLTLPYLYRYAQKEKMPLIGFSGEMTRHGAILSTSGSYSDMGHQAVLTAQEILSGRHPQRLQYTGISHQYFNTRVARLLDIPIPNQEDRLESTFTFFPRKNILRRR